jgi:hypothetical protein
MENPTVWPQATPFIRRRSQRELLSFPIGRADPKHTTVHQQHQSTCGIFYAEAGALGNVSNAWRGTTHRIDAPAASHQL